MKPSAIAGIIVVAVIAVGAGAFILTGSNDTPVQQTANTSTPPPTQSGSVQPAQPDAEEAPSDTTDMPVTFTEVQQHSTREDCWTVIEGNVYNLTPFINSHPGGDNILSACGTDATAYFNGQQAGQNGGANDHSSFARTQLGDYYVGELSE